MPTYKRQSTGTSVSLSDKDYVADGGEGTIYTQGGLAYKICHAGKMMPEGKISELSVLSAKPHIIVPNDILLDSKGQKVGYTMSFVPQKQCWPLAQTFTNSFKQREGLDNQSVLDMIKFMRENIEFIHRNGILVVDMNEFNFLADKKFDKVYFIDTNSYQTKSYPATAIMDSIRDRHVTKFNELSDWFSFGIISFEMLIGIHPFRGGSHPKFPNGNADERMDARMKANVSVLNPQAKYPKGATQSFSVIPQAYLDWYVALFEHGKRVPPPADFSGAVIAVMTIPVLSSENLVLSEYKKLKDTITGYYFIGGREYIVTGVKKKTVYDGVREYPLAGHPELIHCGDTLFAASIENDLLVVKAVFGKSPLNMFTIQADAITSYDNRLYVKSNQNIFEVQMVEHGLTNIVPTPVVVAKCSENSTKLCRGLAVQNWFNTNFLTIFPNGKTSHNVRIKELDKHAVIDAEYNRGVAVVTSKCVSTGKQYTDVIKFSPDFASYTLRRVENGGAVDINYTVLDNGVCVLLNQDNDLELFSSHTASGGVKLVEDKTLTGNISVYSRGAKVLMAKGHTLYEASLKH